jgi:uncharacterized membrane protein YgcG
MLKTIDPFRFVLLCLAGWVNQQQQHAIDYLREENRILRAQIGNRRLRFTDRERRRLAAQAKRLGRKLLAEIAIVVTPETLLAWTADCTKVRRKQEAWSWPTPSRSRGRGARGPHGDG